MVIRLESFTFSLSIRCRRGNVTPGLDLCLTFTKTEMEVEDFPTFIPDKLYIHL